MTDDLQLLADGYLENTLSDEQVSRLEGKLQNDPEAKRQFVAYTVLHGQLGIVANELRSLDMPALEEIAVAPPSTSIARTHPRSFLLAWTVALAGALLIAVATFYSSRRGNEVASEVDYELQAIPLRTVGYVFSRSSPEKAIPVLAGSNASPDATTQTTAGSGADIRVASGTLFGFSTDKLGLLFDGTVHVSVADTGSEYAVDVGNRRFRSHNASFELTKLDALHVKLSVHRGSVEIQGRTPGPRLRWSFDGELNGIGDDLPFVLHGKATRASGILGRGALHLLDRRGTYAEIVGGVKPTVGSGEFAFSGGMTIEAVISSTWNAERDNQDVIFRKEDGPNRILLSFQNNMKDYEIPKVKSGPSLSFGIFLQQLGYSELDMPLDGQEGRPTVAQIADGQPHHIATTYDSFTGLKAIAVDGRICFSHRFPIGHCIQSGGPKPAIIGGWRNRESFAGVIDELAIYDYALSPKQIARHHQLVQQQTSWFPERSNPNRDWRTVRTIQQGEIVELDADDAEPQSN